MTVTSAKFDSSRPVVQPRPARVAADDRGWIVPGAEELFRSLYTGFELAAGTSIAVCSAVSGEGKTTISLGLASAIAHDLADRRVVVVETDLWRPVLAADFGIDPSPGLVDCLLEREPVASVLRRTALDNLSLLVAGGPVSSPQRLLRSGRMPELVEVLRRTHDVVIMDMPATLAHSEVALLSRMVEDVVFVVRTGVTPQADLTRALAKLSGNNVRGIIVNDASSAVPGSLRQLMRL